MKHLDGDLIALLALGETVDDAARAHLAQCAHCRAEVAELAALVGAARDGGPDLEPPSRAVWGRIRSRIDADDDAAAAPAGAPGSAITPSGRQGGRGSVAASRPAGRDDTGARTRSRRPRRPGARAWSFVAGAVVAALVVLAVVWAVGVRSGDRVLASASLAPVASSGGTASGSGSAELARTANGIEELKLQVGADRVRGYPEVWLIARDGKRMVSLGTLHDGAAVLPVPAGLDVRDYATVDVSDEPFDGDPRHSGDSILRGSLTF